MEKRRSVQLTRIIDGDTVEVMVRRGLLRREKGERIRLYGIDAPESSQKGGRDSTRHLRKITRSDKKIWLESSGTDQYGRTIGLIYGRDGRANSYNYQMVAEGQAHCYMLDGFDQPRFREAEQEARRKRKGVWKQKNPTYPWDYRKAHKSGGMRIPWKLRLALLAAALLAIAAWHLYNNLEQVPRPPGTTSLPSIPGLPGLPDVPGVTSAPGPNPSQAPTPWEKLKGR